MNQSYETWPQPENPALWNLRKESKLKLSLETRNRGDVMIVYCQGRIVYRDEASAFARFVSEILQQTPKVVIELSGVTSMDSAGIGELALLHTKTKSDGAALKCAGANSFVRSLLDLTNLDSVLEIHSSLEEALEAFSENEVCSDC